MSENTVTPGPRDAETSESLSISRNRSILSPDQFNEILKERKTDRKPMAKEKCKADARVIQERKSREGIQPGEIFPPEVWKMILNELSPEDKASMCELHKMFGMLMQSTKIQDILMPKMIESEVMKFDYNRNFDDRDYNMIPPPATYSTLRSLSTSIRDAVDNYQENNLLKYLRYEIVPRIHSTPTFPSLNIRHVLGGDVEGRRNKILQHFLDRAAAGEDGKWDFRMRNLDIKIETGRNSNEYLADVTRFETEVTCFLKQVGHNIWRLHFNCGDFRKLTDVAVLSKLYKAICTWLELMPQLKWLSIKLTKSDHPVLPPLQEMVQVGPAPKLENLERFDMIMMTPRIDVSSFFMEVLKSNSQIRKFRYFRSIHETVVPFGDEFLLSASTLLPNLDTLDLMNVVVEAFRIAALQNCMNYNWQLKNLFLCLESDYNCINDVFRFLEKFPTLEDVALKLFDLVVSKPPGEEEKDHISFLRLPNLRKFHLILHHNNPNQFCSGEAIRVFFNLHFLLPCSELRSSKWETAVMNSTIKQTIGEQLELTPEEGMVNFWDGRKDLRKSNIRNVFPHLENVIVQYVRRTGIKHNRICRYGTSSEV